MADKELSDRDRFQEQVLLVKQSLKYAEDLAHIYEEEKDKRKALEESNDKLKQEVARRIKTEKALRESEERFRAIFETARDCIYVKDSSLRYIQVNPAMEMLFRLKSSDMVGNTDSDLFGTEIGLRLQETDKRVLQGESIEEERARPVGGIPRTFLETKMPLRDASKEIIGLFGIARDITDRKRTEPIQSPFVREYPSEAMRDVLAKARLVAEQDTIVLLLGESGSGKDYMARFIHDNSNRSDGAFFSINCASVSPEIAESELFGHEAGAFTGARSRKRGLLELAEAGTLFLNEIGDLSHALQAKLLTFLDSKSFTRVGGEKPIAVNARLIAATNKDLEKEAEEGRFRLDLFHRLNVLSITIPPLRKRREDIPLLVSEIVTKLQEEIRLISPPAFDDDILEALKTAPWPGNVRQLRNCLERALILSKGGKIDLSLLGIDQGDKELTPVDSFEGESMNEILENVKRTLVTRALDQSKGSIKEASKILGISRGSLKHHIQHLGIQK
jgi:PAS domain S-box-containing protein